MRRIALVLVTLVVAIGSTIAFAVRAVAQPEPTASVSPAENLLDGQRVSIDGVDWPASTRMTVQECDVVPNAPQTCFPAQPVMTDGAGSFTTSYVVHRFFSNADCVTTIDAG